MSKHEKRKAIVLDLFIGKRMSSNDISNETGISYKEVCHIIETSERKRARKKKALAEKGKMTY